MLNTCGPFLNIGYVQEFQNKWKGNLKTEKEKAMFCECVGHPYTLAQHAGVASAHQDWNQQQPLLESMLPEKSGGCQARLFDVTIWSLFCWNVILFDIRGRYPNKLKEELMLSAWNGTCAFKWMLKLHLYEHFVCNRQGFITRCLPWHRNKQLRQKAYLSIQMCNSKI